MTSTMNAAPDAIYDFNVREESGYDVTMEKYKGKVVIVVNFATNCHYADLNFKGFKKLSEAYYKKGLRIACFPCNQFMGQEPTDEAEIRRKIRNVYHFDPDLYGLVEVNGAKADPLFNFLKDQQGGVLIDAIKWNFTKFLVNKKGKCVKRISPNVDPITMVADIEKLLAEK